MTIKLKDIMIDATVGITLCQVINKILILNKFCIYIINKQQVIGGLSSTKPYIPITCIVDGTDKLLVV